MEKGEKGGANKRCTYLLHDSRDVVLLEVRNVFVGGVLCEVHCVFLWRWFGGGKTVGLLKGMCK